VLCCGEGEIMFRFLGEVSDVVIGVRVWTGV